jgi:hypothetical protein
MTIDEMTLYEMTQHEMTVGVMIVAETTIGANVIIPFTVVIYCHSMAILSFLDVKL